MAFVVMRRPFLTTRSQHRSLPSVSLTLQQHRSIPAAASLRNSIIVCCTSYPYGEEIPYEKELMILERRRDELETLQEVYTKSRISSEHRWLNTLQMVIQFYYMKGRLPKRRAVEEEVRLANWIHRQRCAKRCFDKGSSIEMNKMTPERISILESITWWSWDSSQAAWQSSFEELVDYVKGTSEVPPQSYPFLGRWVNTQRTAYQAWQARLNGETEKYKSVNAKMDEERASRLELVPGWQWDMRDTTL